MVANDQLGAPRNTMEMTLEVVDNMGMELVRWYRNAGMIKAVAVGREVLKFEHVICLEHHVVDKTLN